jgi:mRNA-degrading endonuclease RelE of RelBE toxin-antitoxin system
VYEFITTTLLGNPKRIGKPLMLPPYQGTWSARRGTYRVLYEIDDEAGVVTVTAIEHRANVYRSRDSHAAHASSNPAWAPPFPA